MQEKEQMNIVIVGHVDHGKSTVIGRLLADTNSLPEGKLQQVKDYCAKNSKPFEYAFLLDALKDEQAQGITIDSARCFFKTEKRDYIIIDAPGHIEFLKNMISGAARAEAALLVIDAKEGVQENSKRHGYMLSMLGIKQVVVCVNKMDLVDYDESVFNKIKDEYNEFLKDINITPKEFIPISALKGDNISSNSSNLSWFNGNTILSSLDEFQKEKPAEEKPFRMPVQDVYKFTNQGDDRRIFAGRVESGSIKMGDKVVFLPSNKFSEIKSIECFNRTSQESVSAGYSSGFTLTQQIYVKRGEIMCKANEKLPFASTTFNANLFWMGKQPMVKDKEYKLKLATLSVPVRLTEITNTMDASNLSKAKKDSIERHEIAECVFECLSPVAFDVFSELPSTGRFVIVDNYDISGGGIITCFIEDPESKVRQQVLAREKKWYHGVINQSERAAMYGQMPRLILLTGEKGIDKQAIAKNIERHLFSKGRKVYFLGIGNLLRGLDADIEKEKREEHIRRLGEVAHIMLDAGLIVVATASDITEGELRLLQTLNSKESMIVVKLGKKGLEKSLVDLTLPAEQEISSQVEQILNLLKFKNVIIGF